MCPRLALGHRDCFVHGSRGVLARGYMVLAPSEKLPVRQLHVGSKEQAHTRLHAPTPPSIPQKKA